VFLLVGFGGDAKQKSFRQLTQEEATAPTVRVANQESDPPEVADLHERRQRVLVGTWSSTNSAGGDAWLSIFRLTRVENDADQACIWVWRATTPPDPYGFEEVPSVAWGREGDSVHERCWTEVRKRGIAEPDQTGGSELPPPSGHGPDVVGTFGSRVAGLYPVENVGGLSITGLALELPTAMPSGTCGVAGFVIDASTEKPVRGATVGVTPSHAWSGISNTRTTERPGAAKAISDRRGAFAVGWLPDAGQGLDVTITAPGYAAAMVIHEDCAPGDFMVGDWRIGATPRLEDATPQPVAR
jgi:hypothetical protein